MDVEFARRQMIEQQVRAWRVLDDRVLGVMTQVRRELFVPPDMRELAFADTGIPLAHGQSMFSPKVEGRDDVTGEELIQRDDDREETVRNRLSVYREQTRPLVDYYSSWAQKDPAAAPKYRKISGVGAVDEIKSRLFEAVKS